MLSVHVLSIFKIGCASLWCSVHFSFSSVAQSRRTLCNPMGCSTPGFPVHHQLLELAQLKSIESVIPSNLLTRWCPLLLLPSIFPRIRVFSNESALCIRWPKYWNFRFSFSPSNEYSPTPQFKNINSLALRFFYGPTLTSFHDYWKNHSFD